MTDKLGIRLREVKKDLEETIDKIDSSTVLFYSIHAKCVLDTLTYQNENYNVEKAALEARILIDNQNISSKKCIKVIKKFLKVLDEELPKEEKIDFLEDIISKTEISFPTCDYDLQEEFHKNARAIARLLVKEK